MAQPFKRILLLDYETRYALKPQEWCPLGDDLQRTAYTLSKMTNEEYVRSKCFKAFGASLKWFAHDAPATQWYGHGELPRIFQTINWDETAVVAHNAQFDVSILSWRYGIQPAFIFDTLSMARALRGVHGKNSLAAIAEDFGLPAKGTAIGLSDGVFNLEDVPGLERKLAEYCNHDVFLLEEIFKRFLMMFGTRHDSETDEICGGGGPRDIERAYEQSAWRFPKKELRLVDMTLRMYTRPLLELDTTMLEEAIGEEAETRTMLLQRLGVTDGDLASNDRFAEILRGLGVEPPTKKKRPTAKTPNPVGVNFAFAKTDALFQAMLNGDDENVSMLCEARLKVKSTTERTRAQRFVDIASRGPLPVPLSYFGAGTGRWTAAKGSAINMQNLKRGSFLRKAIMAPKGYKVGVGDLSQIEPRVLAWLADYDDLLDIFRAKKDAYSMFGAQMFNTPGLTKETHPDLRQSAKSAMLGCFGADTLVLTRRGWVPIVSVQLTDTIWDGVEWVAHQGVLQQGERDVLTRHGVSATSDHEILTARGWVEWHEVLADRSLLTSALSSASLPAQGGSGRSTRTGPVASSPECGAAAGGRGSCTGVTYNTDARHGATPAQNGKQSRLAGNSGGTLQSAQTANTATGCSIASARLWFGAQTQRVQLFQTTAAAASQYIRRGWQIVSRFFATSSASMGGIGRSYSSIARTTSAGTFRGTCASSREASTCPTSAALLRETLNSSSSASETLRQRMQTYDIALAGPRSRFTILTAAGPLIVHNCGYQLGWASFAGQLLVGFLGAPPIRYDKAFAKKLGVDKTYIERFLEYKDNVVKMMEIPHICTTEELLIHCVAAKRIIDIYRATAAPVVGLWELFQQLIPRSLADGEEYTHKCLLFRKEEIVLPNGMSMHYPNLRQQKNPDTKKMEWVYGDDATRLYAGKIANNVTQGTARIVMTDGMLRTADRYAVVGTVHDEQITLIPDEEADEGLEWMLGQMTREPKYMPGIPLAADGGVHRRYGLAKT